MQRRSFIKGILATGISPIIYPAFAKDYSKNSLINIGVVGFGRIACSMDVPRTIKYTNRCRFTAVSDVDALRRGYGVNFITNAYKRLLPDQQLPIKTFGDYRELLADESIDAVMLCIPDHWHAIAATDAILAKKHVWLQKPFTQTIEEGRILRELAIKHRTVMQVGSWQRSTKQFALVCELAQNGRIGDIVKVEVGCGLDKEGGSSALEQVPATLDYDRWLGPTPGADVTPYNETRVHSQNLKNICKRPGWIQLEPYGWGMITNWGAHQLDVAQWGLGMDDSGPESVEGECKRMSTEGGKLWNVHTTYDLHYSYNGGKTEVNVSDRYPMGIKFIGEKGDWLFCMRGASVTASDPKDTKAGKLTPLMASDKKLLEPIANPEKKVHTSNDHWLDWLEGVQAGNPELTCTNAKVAQRSATACNLGYMCMKLGKKIEWNAKTETSPTAGIEPLMKPFARGEYNLNRAIAALNK